jgi:hypothetical protein
MGPVRLSACSGSVTIIDNYRRQLQSSRWRVQKQRTTSLEN